MLLRDGRETTQGHVTGRADHEGGKPFLGLTKRLDGTEIGQLAQSLRGSLCQLWIVALHKEDPADIGQQVHEAMASDGRENGCLHDGLGGAKRLTQQVWDPRIHGVMGHDIYPPPPTHRIGGEDRLAERSKVWPVSGFGHGLDGLIELVIIGTLEQLEHGCGGGPRSGRNRTIGHVVIHEAKCKQYTSCTPSDGRRLSWHVFVDPKGGSMAGFYAPAFSQGWIEVICGSMYCGKTEELIRRVRRAEIAKQKVQAFKPMIDTRYFPEDISSHGGLRMRAIRAEGSAEILPLVEPDTQVVALDEVQFFDMGMVEVVQQLADAGKRVVCAGLDLDFRGQPFALMPHLLAVAEKVEKLTAICVLCGGPATRSQRLIDGRPASWDDPIVLVGASESYEPRCRQHHVIPRPEQLPLAPLGTSPSATPVAS